MKKQKLTPTQRLLNEFKKGRKFTTHSANLAGLTTCLPKRVCDFQKLGYVFYKTKERTKAGTLHNVYYLNRIRTPQKLM